MSRRIFGEIPLSMLSMAIYSHFAFSLVRLLIVSDTGGTLRLYITNRHIPVHICKRHRENIPLNDISFIAVQFVRFIFV